MPVSEPVETHWEEPQHHSEPPGGGFAEPEPEPYMPEPMPAPLVEPAPFADPEPSPAPADGPEGRRTSMMDVLFPPPSSAPHEDAEPPQQTVRFDVPEYEEPMEPPPSNMAPFAEAAPAPAGADSFGDEMGPAGPEQPFDDPYAGTNGTGGPMSARGGAYVDADSFEGGEEDADVGAFAAADDAKRGGFGRYFRG